MVDPVAKIWWSIHLTVSEKTMCSSTKQSLKARFDTRVSRIESRFLEYIEDT